ncbi:methylated-DNA--[protein]-cysteine S-methyltransferase [Dongia sp. agr-C8]
MTDALHQYAVFETAAGFCAIGWTPAGIARFQLPDRDAATAERNMLRRFPAAQPGTPPSPVAAAIAAARRYFAGEAVDFTDIELDLEGQDEFFGRIYAALRSVGYGQVTTYGSLAKALGAGPEAARAVGQAMAKNPVPLIIPCHRVLAAGNKVGGFSAPGGADSKLKMLALEGVDLSPPPPAQQSLAF